MNRSNFHSGSITALRVVSAIEGLSWLVLLFIAMPLKYATDKPEAVSLAGRAHGGLFVLFGIVLAFAWWKNRRWDFGTATLLFTSSLIPFGFLWAEKWLRRDLLRGQKGE